MMSAPKTLKRNLSIAVAAVFLAVAAFASGAIEPSKAYADTTDSHLTVASEVHVLVDGEGNVTIPNATVTNDGTCAAYIMGCSAPDGLGWTCDAVGKRIEAGQSITATWRSAGPVSAEIAAQLGEEPYYAGNLTYTYTDGALKGTVSLDNTDPTVGDTITATVTDANVSDDKLTYQWVKVKDGSDTTIDGATGPTYTATDDDAGYELVCKVSSTDDICQGTISGATGAVKKVQAFAVFSPDDGSLSFYKRAIAELPAVGSQFEGKTAIGIFTGIEDTGDTVPWNIYTTNIRSAIAVDNGIQPKSTANWFSGFGGMTSCDLAKLDMSQNTSMNKMFYQCSSLTDLDLSSWNTSKVTTLSNAFASCPKLETINLTGWDTGNTTDMSKLFNSCAALTAINGISDLNVSNVTDMQWMFFATKLTDLDLSSWNVSQVTTMQCMFNNCSSLSSINFANWDTSKVTDTMAMLYGCTSLTSLDFSGWDTSNVTNGGGMLSGCNHLREVTLGENWVWANGSWLSSPDSDYIPGADGKWYAVSDMTGYDSQSIPEHKADTYVATPPVAFAVYSDEDKSLNFYKRLSAPTAGEQFEGKTATAVFTGFETRSYYPSTAVPWHAYQSNIKTSSVVDDGVQPVSTAYWFSNLINMTQCDVSKLDMSQSTSMTNMFSGCSSLTSIGNLSGWNTSSVINMYGMFQYCSHLTTVGDLSAWNTSNVTYMGQMFLECPSLTTVGDLSNWDTSKVTNMTNMFHRCKSLTSLDLSNWDTSKVTDMISIFWGCSSLTSVGDLSSWDTSKVTDMNSMFYSCENLTTVGDLSNWDTSKVTTMNSMFSGCSSLTTVGDLSSWDTSKVTDMSSMFSGCSSLTTLDLSNWDTSKVTDMSSMFASCSSLTSLDLSNWNTSNVTAVKTMFGSCSSLTSVGDLSSWDTSKVTDMYGMFLNCRSLTTVGDLSNWDTSKVTTMSSMFSGCSSLTTLGDLSNWDTSKVTDMNSMFYSCENLTTVGDLSNWDTSKVTTMSTMFSGCSSLTTLDLSNWDTSKVTYMTSMFYACSKLQEVTLGDKWQWVGTNGYLPTPSSQYITGADGMWYADSDGAGYAPSDVPALKADTYRAVPPAKTAFAVYSADDGSLDFYKRSTVPSSGEQFNGKTATAVYTGIEDTGFNQPWSSNAANIRTVDVVDNNIQPKSTALWFANCTNMTQCDASKLDVSQDSNIAYMFYNCTSLSALNGLSGWNTSNVTDMSSLFYNCRVLSTVDDLSNWNTTNVSRMDNMFHNCNALTSLGSFKNWNTGNVTGMSYMFSNCNSLMSVDDLSHWNTSNVTDMTYMFSNMPFTSLDLSNWDTSKLTSADSMFYGCTSLASLNVSTWNTTNVTNIRSMLFNCQSLTSLDLTNWDTTGVTNMGNPFEKCLRLQEVTLGDKWQWVGTNGYLPTPNPQSITGATGKWYADSDGAAYAPSDVPALKADTYRAVPPVAFAVYSADDNSLDFYKRSTVPSPGEQFNGKTATAVYTGIEDTSIKRDSNGSPINGPAWQMEKNEANLSCIAGWDTANVTDMSYMFSGCSNLTTIGDLSNWDTSNVTNMDAMFYGCPLLQTDCSNWDVAKVTWKADFNTNAPGVILPLAWQTSASADTSGSNAVVLNAPTDEHQDNGSNVDVGDGDAASMDGAEQESGSGQEVDIAA